MKKLLLLVLLCGLWSNAQKIEILKGPVEPMVGTNIYVLANDIDKDKKYLIDMGDGQQFVLEHSQAEEGKSNSVNHSYSEPKSYIIKLQEVDETGAFKIIDMQNLNINAAPTKLILTSVILKGFSPVKEGDQPWDTYWGGTYPDVFLYVTDGKAQTIASNYDDYIPVLKRDKLPVELLKSPIEIDLTKVDGDFLQLLVFDKDTTTDHDFIGGVRLSILPAHLIASKGEYNSYEDDDGYFKIDYKFEIK